MILRNFRIDDLDKNDGFLKLPVQHRNILGDLLLGSKRIAYTLEHDGEIIGSAGIVEYWDGVYEGWALISDLIFKYPIAVHKAVKTMIPHLEAKHGIRRLQTLCLKIDGHKKWLEKLGFNFEGEMPRYGINGETYLRYARVR